MVNTRRTEAQILALFADNAVGDVSPQDLRDYVVSTSPHHALASFDRATPIATTIGTAGTYVKAAGNWDNATIVSNAVLEIASGTPNRITYIGTDINPQHCIIQFNVSIDSGNNQEVHLAPAINGVLDESWEQQQIIASTNAPYSVSVIGHFILAPNDYVELWLTNVTSTSPVTITSGSIFAQTTFE